MLGSPPLVMLCSASLPFPKPRLEKVKIKSTSSQPRDTEMYPHVRASRWHRLGRGARKVQRDEMNGGSSIPPQLIFRVTNAVSDSVAMRPSGSLALALWLCLASAVRAAVLAIDYGAEFTKLSLVKPGVPFDVVLDRDSKRKISSVVGWKRDDRVFGAEGKMAVRPISSHSAIDMPARQSG